MVRSGVGCHERGRPPLDLDPEDAGGSGGTLVDAMAVLRLVGRHAAPVPVAETGPLAGWLATTAGLDLAKGPASVVPGDRVLEVDGGRLHGEAIVAWGGRAARIFAVVDGPGGPLVVAADPAQVDVTGRANLAGEPRDLVRFDVALADVEHVPAPAECDRAQLLRRGSLTRTVLSAGALEAMSQLTIDYTNDRRQFGRPVAAFQAVQHHLVTVAQCAVRASDGGRPGHAGGRRRWRRLRSGGGEGHRRCRGRGRHACRPPGARRNGCHTRVPSAPPFAPPVGLAATSTDPSSGWRRQLGVEVAMAGADSLFPSIARSHYS